MGSGLLESTKAVAMLLEEQIHKDLVCNKIYLDLCESLSKKHYGITSEVALNYQQQYILAETALSIHMTECNGYPNELYARDDLKFINYLYTNKAGLLMSLLKKHCLSRRFFAFEQVLHSV